MQTNHPGEPRRKPFLWIIPLVLVLLVGIFAIFSLYSRRHLPLVSTPVVARGKIPLPPPSPSVNSNEEPSTPVQAAPSAEADRPDDETDTRDRKSMESASPDSMEAGPNEATPEMKTEIAEAPHEDAAIGTQQEPVEETDQTRATGSSENQESEPVPGNDRSKTSATEEPQVALQEPPDSAPSSDSVAPAPSGLKTAKAEPAQSPASQNVMETVAPYSIQVGAFRAKDNADRQIAQMQKTGFEAYIYEKNDKNQRTWYFVRFGRFRSVKAAKQALAALKEQHRMDGAIVRSK